MDRRKKDHGRAEALLVAAYGLGVRAAPLAAALPGSDVAATEGEGDVGGRVLDDDLIQIST